VTTGPTSPRDRHILLSDGSFWIESDPALSPLLSRWLPLLPYADRIPASTGSGIRIGAGNPCPRAATSRPDLKLGNVSAWISGDGVRLSGESGAEGRLRLRRGVGAVRVPEHAEQEAAGWDVYSMSTLALALLLGRRGKALVHAAAPVAPDGRVWLLAGDSHAGKSTTCANLLTAGWRFTSDDHVVLSRDADGQLWVEGLPRRFHLDAGWGEDRPVGVRGETDPRAAWPGRWLERAPLAGVLLPQVVASRPTRVQPASPAEALAELIRQSPWLMADRAAAPALLALLRDAAAVSPHRLRLGLDTFASPHVLAAVLSPLS
jgi:hypothetical protein